MRYTAARFWFFRDVNHDLNLRGSREVNQLNVSLSGTSLERAGGMTQEDRIVKRAIKFINDRSWGKRLLGGLFLACGTICLVLTVFYLARDLSLWILGRRTTGQVVEMWSEQTSADDQQERTFRYFLRYEFATPDGRVFTRSTSVAPQEWVGLGRGAQQGPGGSGLLPDESGMASGVYQEQANVPPATIGGLEVGRPIDVVYFPLYPAHNRLDESRLIPVLVLAYVPFVALSLVGLRGGLHLMRADPPPETVPSIREILGHGTSGGALG